MIFLTVQKVVIQISIELGKMNKQTKNFNRENIINQQKSQLKIRNSELEKKAIQQKT